jgi:hypothetical protein
MDFFILTTRCDVYRDRVTIQQIIHVDKVKGIGNGLHLYALENDMIIQ